MKKYKTSTPDPFVRTVTGMADCRAMIEAQGLVRSADFKLWMMVEVPSNIFLIEKFIAVGIDGISIGSNDLTQLMLGTDRDSQKLSHIFDERNEAVLMALEKAITTAKKMGIPVLSADMDLRFTRNSRKKLVTGHQPRFRQPGYDRCYP